MALLRSAKLHCVGEVFGARPFGKRCQSLAIPGRQSGSGSSQRLLPAQDPQQRIDIDVTIDKGAPAVCTQHFHATAT